MESVAESLSTIIIFNEGRVEGTKTKKKGKKGPPKWRRQKETATKTITPPGKMDAELGKRQLVNVMITTDSTEDICVSGKKRKQGGGSGIICNQNELEVVLVDQHRLIQ